jgi:cysteine desulfurase family protein (TIGR01976 family)
MAFDVILARAQFPSLSGGWIFMDNAGGSQVPLQVVDGVREYLLNHNVQHGATYEVSRRSQEAVEAGRRFVAGWIGASPEEIVFGQNASQLLRMLALVLSAKWEPGDEIVITQAEHEANAGCWEFLEQFGMVVKTWEIDPDRYTFELGRLSEVLTERTKLVALHHSSNILGNVMPVRDVVKLAHGAGALVCVDGVGYVPHRLVDVADLGADFYVFSAYKAFGPHLGVLYGRKDVMKEMVKWNHFFIEDDKIPGKYELGSGSYELAAGLAGLERYFRALGRNMTGPLREVLTGVFDDVSKHETKLTRNFLSYLASKRRVHVVGESDPRLAEERLPVFSFVVEDADPEEICRAVDKAKVGTRWGHFYAVRLLDSLDLLQYKGVVRVSLVHYNTETELGRLKEVLDPLLS